MARTHETCTEMPTNTWFTVICYMSRLSVNSWNNWMSYSWLSICLQQFIFKFPSFFPQTCIDIFSPQCTSNLFFFSVCVSLPLFSPPCHAPSLPSLLCLFSKANSIFISPARRDGLLKQAAVRAAQARTSYSPLLLSFTSWRKGSVFYVHICVSLCFLVEVTLGCQWAEDAVGINRWTKASESQHQMFRQLITPIQYLHSLLLFIYLLTHALLLQLDEAAPQ